MAKKGPKRSDDFRKGAGRPPKYDTAEELFEAIAQHFDDCEERGEAPTVNSLALALGFTQRNALDYTAKRGAEFSNIIARAKLFIVTQWERKGESARSSQFHKFILERMKGSGYEENDVSGLAGTIKLSFGFPNEEEEEEEDDLDDAGVEG